MTRNLLAMIGLLTLVIGLGIWQFDYFSQVKQQIERDSAVHRANMIVGDMEKRGAELSERTRKLRVDARTREKQLERDEAQTSKTKAAIQSLAKAAIISGLPKPTEATPEDLAKTLSFAGKSLPASEVYSILERWQAEVRRNNERLTITRTMIDRIRSTADQLESKQEKYLTQVQNTRATLERLELQRDLAALDKELAELGATTSGNPVGDLKGVMETLQKQIDEYESTSEVLATESANLDDLTPDEALSGSTEAANVRHEIDAIWDQREDMRDTPEEQTTDKRE